ncbi:MAG: site-specific DNA-methyltransferase [Ruminococcus flavefaciens]|nr:site-specific DNA-methyltransferase [Ruminococcus flavefaciens]
MDDVLSLLDKVEDVELRQKIADAIKDKEKYGLVFEETPQHSVLLYEREVEDGCVACLDGDLGKICHVARVDGETARCLISGESKDIPVRNLVYLLDGDARTSLKLIDRIGEKGHVVIEGENYYGLKHLTGEYRGKVDCIYIDPPYNTGDTDWKYNNDYVDRESAYRHSKWLSMMKERLVLAKELLNPANSVMITAIDEKEYLRLGMLLEEVFPEARIQMITTVINPGGQSRKNLFSRADEYLYFVFMGDAKVCKHEHNMLSKEVKTKSFWVDLIRKGTDRFRHESPKLFYPLFFDGETNEFRGAGEVPDLEMDRNSIAVPEGCYAFWPIQKSTGLEARWMLSPGKLMDKFGKGYVKFSRKKDGRVSRVCYLPDRFEKEISEGKIKVLEREKDGTVVLDKDYKFTTIPVTVWNQTSHNAGEFGSKILSAIFRNTVFTYPKSLYAVRDALKMVTADKPDALILDFFAGSGTTLHATCLLNREDGGHRKCLLVTNNEVSRKDAERLKKEGYCVHDEEWRNKGVARAVTWPRVKCVINGVDITGEKLKGKYRDTEFAMSDGFREDASFYKLEYEEIER